MTETSAPKTKSAAHRDAWDGDPPHRTAARERLLEVAARCVARDGIHGTGIAHVAIEAGVSRPTVYRYFKDLVTQHSCLPHQSEESSRMK